MTEEREDMDEEILVERHQHLHHLMRTCHIKGIFIFLDGKAQEMTVVVEYDTDNGQSPQGICLRTT